MAPGAGTRPDLLRSRGRLSSWISLAGRLVAATILFAAHAKLGVRDTPSGSCSDRESCG